VLCSLVGDHNVGSPASGEIGNFQKADVKPRVLQQKCSPVSLFGTRVLRPNVASPMKEGHASKPHAVPTNQKQSAVKTASLHEGLLTERWNREVFADLTGTLVFCLGFSHFLSALDLSPARSCPGCLFGHRICPGAGSYSWSFRGDRVFNAAGRRRFMNSSLLALG
jgi:hypothetical protein